MGEIIEMVGRAKLAPPQKLDKTFIYANMKVRFEALKTRSQFFSAFIKKTTRHTPRGFLMTFENITL